ncbi:MAG: biotin-dependent carboxyltransferase family protein [Oscillospiraceae bacterium]|jgi:biotin-dependent carboxylase-like uncharacterized protein|nr:biotin-dependent carboxyltransferase family protein [Oscillospiraceae bacterium]
MLSIMVPGPLAMLQDMGVVGYQSAGFPQTGAADKDALRKANLLVGNAQNEACIEMVLMGITTYFTKAAVIAITGADIAPQLNWEPIPMNRAIAVKKGDTFTSSYAKSGCRAYFAIAGGFDVPRVMGSKSTNLKLKTGGFEGRKLRTGDLLPYQEISLPPETLAKRSIAAAPYDKQVTLRVVLGPQENAFTENGMNIFLSSEYLVDPNSDRMGIRLKGEAVESQNGTDIISDGIAYGSVQIPANGQPIILGADRQTTGGYVKIATVITRDMPKTAQLKPGDAVRFAAISVKEAQKLYKAYEKEMRALAKRFQ